MTIPDNSHSAEADESRLSMVLFYLGDGIIIGAVFYFGIAFVLFLFSDFFAGAVSRNPALYGFLAVAFLFIGGRFLMAGQWLENTFPEKIKKWTNERRLWWVAAISLLVTGLLFGGALRLGWLALVTFFIPAFLLCLAVVIGLAFRILGKYKS